jgi:folate-binding protein YgfZ
LTGDDSESFLQGQLTNDLSELNPGQSQLSAYCNPKGRILAIFRLLKTEEGYCLLCPRDLIDAMAKRLQLYKMRAVVKVIAHTDLQLIGLINNDCMIAEQTEWQCRIDDNRTIVAVTSNHYKELGSCDLPVTNSTLWKLTDIIAGQPQVYAATSEEFIPQQINLDLIDGVSFSKGCYPGQEIVARIRYLGKLKQRMIVGRAQTDHVLQPGTAVFGSDRPDQKAGMVVDAIELGDSQLFSAMVSAKYLESGDLTLVEPVGEKINRIALPYTVTLEKTVKVN